MELLKEAKVCNLYQTQESSISSTSSSSAGMIKKVLICVELLQEPKDFDILAIPLTSTAIKMLRMRQGTPEEWLQYLAM